MQISSVSSQTFKCNICNEERIHELEQQRIASQWGSEGCTGGLDKRAAYELELREEYQALQNKAIALQWGAEGCNASLSEADLARLEKIKNELFVIEQELKTITTNPIVEKTELNIPTGNIYGVPESTFWGDWAR